MQMCNSRHHRAECGCSSLGGIWYETKSILVPTEKAACLHDRALITNISRYTDAETQGAAATRNVLKASYHTQRPSPYLPAPTPLLLSSWFCLSLCLFSSLFESPGQLNRYTGPGRVEAAAKSWTESQQAWLRSLNYLGLFEFKQTLLKWLWLCWQCRYIQHIVVIHKAH